MSEDKQPHRVDWDALWNELTWDDADHEARVLQQRLDLRARQYAAPRHEHHDALPAAPEAERAYHLLAFRLGGEQYGVPVAHVRAVRARGALTRVPGVPDFYRGVVNMRGQIITALDLRLFFGLGAADDHLPAELILAQANQLRLALLADHVEGVIRVPHHEVASLDMHYAHGVTAERLVVLDTHKLFEDERLMPGHESPPSPPAKRDEAE